MSVERIIAAAIAIANARGGRRGMPVIKNVLDLLPKKLLDEVIEDAGAALTAADSVDIRDAANAELLAALEKSVALQSHYAGLLNMYDGGRRMQFASAEAWCARLAKLAEAKGMESNQQRREGT